MLSKNMSKQSRKTNQSVGKETYSSSCPRKCICSHIVNHPTELFYQQLIIFCEDSRLEVEKVWFTLIPYLLFFHAMEFSSLDWSLQTVGAYYIALKSKVLI